MDFDDEPLSNAKLRTLKKKRRGSGKRPSKLFRITTVACAQSFGHNSGVDSPEDRQIEDLFQRVGPLSDSEKADTLATYFSLLIEGEDRATLLRLRAKIATMHRGTVEHQTVLEIIDGELALRALK